MGGERGKGILPASAGSPAESRKDRILLVGNSISAGYGDMVQRLMAGWYVDRLNTSEGLRHPNFLRMLEIALEKYPYRIVHLINGIYLHGQTPEQYRQNPIGGLCVEPYDCTQGKDHICGQHDL